jgi:hypothetical protein
MSRNHDHRYQRGIKQVLGLRQLPPRAFRHGRVVVGESPRGCDDPRPSPYVKRWRTVEENKVTGLFEVKNFSRLMTLDEVQEVRKLKVAVGPTATYGQKNTGGESAGKKSAKKTEKKPR